MNDGANHRDDLFSKSVRAGKRTYFFDVKTTKGNDLYMTITESKRRFADDGNFQYEKHKLFLYKEDFDKFVEGLQETIERINALRDSGNYSDESPMDRHEDYDDYSTRSNSNQVNHDEEEKAPKQFTDVSFDDLGEE
ncbi:MAG: DUF3276 family protein [Cryomorphaceae bacterium]|nr:DUF3276 family protein [Cryomorphaceae bacterium]